MSEPCGIQIPEGYIHNSVLKQRGWTPWMTRHLRDHRLRVENPDPNVSPYWYPESVVDELGPKLHEQVQQHREEAKARERAAKATARKASAEARKERERKIIESSGRKVIGKPFVVTTYNPGVGVRNAGDVFTSTYENRSGRRFLVLSNARGGWFIGSDDRRVFGIKCRVIEVEPTPGDLESETSRKLDEEARRLGKSEAQGAMGWNVNSDYFPPIPPGMYQSYELGYRLDGAGGHDRVLKLLAPNGGVRLLLDVTPEHIREAWSRNPEARALLVRWGALEDSFGTPKEVRDVLRELSS